MIHILVFDGFADWEAAYALAELRRWGRRTVVAVGFDALPVTSMGGLRVVPEATIYDVNPTETEMLILPGGDLWEGTYPRVDLEALLNAFLESGIPVAAICGATLALARAGVLNHRQHTSNMPSYLTEHVPDYTGHTSYREELAVNDRGVITASGLGPVEFAREIFKELGVFNPSDDQLWFDMFKHGHLPERAV
ncbi:MAG TPA: type 1 glutamine amidotransferase family protein [Longimicrobiales bacterium]